MHILAIDVGTSSVKAAVVAADTGDSAAGEETTVDYRLRHPSPGAAEIDPAELWAAVGDAARTAVRDAGVAVGGVGLSCLMPALVLLDAAGEPIGPIWIHLDRRSRDVARRAREKFGDDFLRQVGTPPLPGGLSAPCCAKRLRDEPGLAGRVRHYLHGNGWLAFRMTGRPAFDPANASFTGLWNTLTDNQWSADRCGHFGVEAAWLPEVVSGDTTLGGLGSSIATDWGVEAGVPVKLGTADTSLSILAADLGPDDLLHSVGTTQVLGRVVESPRPDDRRLTRHLGVGDKYVYIAHNPVGGVALDWIQRLCFADQSPGEFFGKTLAGAAGRDTPVELDPPFLGGDRMEIDEKLAAFRNLTLTADRMDLLGALLAAMRRGHASAMDAIGWAGHTPRVVHITGGGAAAVDGLFAEYEGADVRRLRRGTLRGVARLFRAG